MRLDMEFMRIKATKNMAKQQNMGHGRVAKDEWLEPWQYTSCKTASKQEVTERLEDGTTETMLRQMQAKG